VKARAGFLRLSAPDGKDMWVGNYDAPRLLRPVSGNFIIETPVEFNPTTHYQGAGILIYQDDGNFLRLERGFGGLAPTGNSVSFVKEGEGLVGDAVPIDATRVELRVQRVGNQFTAWWREPNKAWQQIGSTDLDLQPDVQVGVLQVANWGGEQINADFDYVRISRPK
jgi:regulation of enolase protein 1 (concanavalin A-like superfamily)